MRFLRFLLLLVFSVSPVYAFQSVLVLPFNNESQKAELYWLGEGFAESLSEELSIQDAYIIQRRERLAVYDALHLPYRGDLSRATMLKIGETLSSDYLIFGSYSLKNDHLTVRAKIIRISTAKLSNGIYATGPLKNLYQIQAGLAGELKKYFATEKLNATVQNFNGGQTIPLHAYELYIKGLVETEDSEKIRFFQRAIEIFPAYPQAIFRFGQALTRLQRFRESSERLKLAQNSGSLKPRIDFLIAFNSYQLHDYDSAYRQWYDLSQTQPAAEIYNNIGVTLLKKLDLQNSGWYLNQAVTLDPFNDDYRFNLAASYLQRNFDPQAVQQFSESLKYHPNDYQSLYFVAKLLEKQALPVSRSVTETFNDVLPSELKGKFPESYSSVIQLLRIAPAYLSKEEKQYLTASRSNQLQQRTQFVKTYQTNARRYLDDGRPDQAVTEIRKGILFSPFDWYLHYLWGSALYRQGDRNGAFAQLQYSLWCTDNAESHLLLAEIYNEGEQFADAKLQVQQCLALDPKNKRALDLWGRLYNK